MADFESSCGESTSYVDFRTLVHSHHPCNRGKVALFKEVTKTGLGQKSTKVVKNLSTLLHPRRGDRKWQDKKTLKRVESEPKGQVRELRRIVM